MPDTIATAIIGSAATLTVGILTLAGGMFGRWREQQQANRRPFLEKQLALCFEATETVARLATEKNPIEWEKARAKFWQLYWGPLSIVEDPAVERAMVVLGEAVPDETVEDPALPMTMLQLPSLELAHAARHLVLTSWGVRLPALQGRT